MQRRPHPARPIRSALAALRTRLRLYVVTEGIALAVVWLGFAFLAGFALDYLPILLGANEMPRAARLLLLLLIVGGVLYVVFRWILRRIVVPLSDASMALLIERRFGRFHHRPAPHHRAPAAALAAVSLLEHSAATHRGCRHRGFRYPVVDDRATLEKLKSEA